MNDSHVTEDQLTEILIEGAPSLGCQAHLANCLTCREKVSRELLTFGSSMEAFSQASLSWSASRLPPIQVNKDRFRTFRLGFMPAALTFVAAAAMIVAVPAWRQEHRQAATTDNIVIDAQDTPAEIAKDNTLLQSVSMALATNDPSPLDEYKLAESPRPAGKASISRIR